MIRLKFLLYTIALITVVVGERICEKQGTCKRCDGRGRFSYYTCQNDDECFKEERCREGFCCPRINSSILDDPSQRPFSSAFSDEFSGSSSCPDGSSWMRLCKSDLDCLFDDEVCSLGKCCSSCLARRRQILREHPQEALVGYHIPECSEDGRFYQLKQCIHGFPGECFCVSLYGQRTNPSGISGSDIVCGNSIDENLNKPKSPYPEEPSLPKSPYPEEPPQPRIPPFAPPTTETLSQSDHFLTLGRNGFNNGMQQNPTVLCNDRNKEFKPCLNACFVACDTRTKPQCPNAGRCNPGCQCKLPYILESSHDQNSRCILASECSSSTPPSMPPLPQPRREPIILPTPGKVVYKPPIYPFSSDDGFDQFPHGAVGFGVDRSRQMHCIDPLKNFLTCESACPPACGRFSPACSFQCVSGCFCRTPYVLSDVQNANSACILPQHCDIQGSSFDRAILPESAFPSEKTTTSGPAFTEELLSSSLTTTESSLEPITVSSKKSTTTTKSSHRATTILPPITCADKNKEFQSCGSSCPLACDNLDDAQNCSPCVSGCFCKNGYVFESVKNWTDGICVKIEKCSHHENSEDSSTTTTEEPPQMAGIESIGAQLFTTDSHQEIGRFTFSTSVDQKIQFNARITFLPKSKSKTFIIAIHKYGALATDIKCEAIGDVIEINPVYSYPFPNGTLLYLKNPKIPYASSYTFKASNDFAEKSVGAVIGRSLALHEFSNDGSVGEPLGCATVGILQS